MSQPKEVPLRGRIVSIFKYQDRDVEIATGVKQNQVKNLHYFAGGNGTYVVGSTYYGTVLEVKVVVYANDKYGFPQQTIKINYYDELKSQLGVSRLMPARLNDFIYANEGKKIDLVYDMEERRIRLAKLLPVA